MSERNWTPTSTDESGPPSATEGAAELDQIEQGQAPLAVGMVMLSACVATCTGLPASLVWTTKLKLPAAPGVPEITPVVGFRVRFAGREPLAMDHLYGGVPPLAARVAE